MMRRFLAFIGLASLICFTACDTANVGGAPNPGGADTTHPTITTVTGVANGENLSGAVAIAATATDDNAVASFTLTLDGTQVADSTNGNLSYNWDTTTATDGAHTLVFTARDQAGNQSTQTIDVTVDNGGGGETATVSGVVYMPNGTDPVSGALVYVRDADSSAMGDPPGEAYLAYDYSEADGAFELAEVPTGTQSIVITKGGFSKTFSYDVEAGINALTPAQTTLPSGSGGGATVGQIAVVTGDYDAIENVLARLGLGEVDASGALTLGTEEFMLIDGDASLEDATYPNFDAWFADETNFANYRTIFLNCGNHYEDDFFADADAVSALRTWVQNGGRLYCTDWSYDFCEQLFPDWVDFYGTDGIDGLGTTPEDRDAAQVGSSMDTILGTLGDPAMLAWLDALGATNADDTANISDWLPDWAVIEAVDPLVKIWVSGPVTYGTPEQTNPKPITISFTVGEGCVLFSSYHTEETPQTTLTPQDRIMEYLIFEIL